MESPADKSERSFENSYIVNSLLDVDFYKFAMGQLIFHKYTETPVNYAFKNRTINIPLADIIKEKDLRRELDHVRTLRFTKTELHYLRGTDEYGERMFKEDYLDFLETLTLPEYYLTRTKEKNATYRLEFRGTWTTAIYWETIALSIVNELYYRSLMAAKSTFERETIYASGVLRLAEKIRTLKENTGITFCDFGTRRRFSRDWQEYVVRTLAKELPANQFLGTSNVYLAMKYGLLPMGTSAHEMFMAMSGIMHDSDEAVRNSHNQVLKDWWEEYGLGLSVALTDTYGTEFFFKDMTAEQARDWKGLRHDSGDPFTFGENALAFYEKHGINPKEKLLVFSDGLDLATILEIAKRFSGRIKVTFGWGTNLTNDLGLKALSLVVKIIDSCGHGTVKLSDNFSKAMGSLEDIQRFKNIFGYTATLDTPCTY